VGFFDEPIKLKSGRLSNWYVNWRTLCSDVYLVDRLADFIIAFLKSKGISFDVIYGVPDGATKIGLIAQYKWASASPDYAKDSHKLLMWRGAPKEHGSIKDRFFLGEPTGKIVVIEDVTTTGGSLIKSIEALKEAGANIVAAVGLTNRMEKDAEGMSVEDAVAKTGVRCLAMSLATEILPDAIKILAPSDKVKKSIKEEFEKFGVEKTKF
jgi:orotate phosphoribosyltransferase